MKHRSILLALVAAILTTGAHAATIGINFAQSSGGVVTGTADGFSNWTNVIDSDGFPGTKTLTGSSVSASWLASNSWSAGSETDVEQRLYARYLDDSQTTPSATFGGTSSDGIGVRVKISGLSAWLAANEHASYQIRCYGNNDAANTFRPIAIHDGTGTGPTLHTMTVAALGDSNYPTSGTPGTGQSRGYVDSIDTLTADTITLTIPKRSGSTRGTLSALRITGIGTAPPVDVLNQVGIASYNNVALAGGKTSVFRVGTDIATITGNFSVTATHTIHAIPPGGGFSIQQYPLVKFPVGTSPAIGAGSFQLLDLPRGVTGGLIIDTTGNPYVLALNVTAVAPAQPLYWNGNVAGGVWDVKSTPNWLYGAAASSYWEGDQVIFDNSAAGTTDVALDAAVLPAGVTVDNDATKPYSITGSGSIGGTGGLTKTGPGTLTLATTNSYEGVTDISEGVVMLGADTALGSSASGTIVANTAAIDLNGTEVSGENFNISGAGPDGAGALINNSFTVAALTSAVTLAANTTLGGGGNTTLFGSMSGAGKNLVKTGSGTITATVAPNVTGTFVVNEGIWAARSGNNLGNFASVTINDTGTIRFETDNGLVGSGPSAAKIITVNDGGTLTTVSNSCHLGSMVLDGGTISAATANVSWANYNFDQPVSTPGTGRTSYISGGNLTVSQTGGSVFTIGTGDTLNVSSVISGDTGSADTGLIKSGPGTMLLAAGTTHTYDSATAVNEGTLQVDGTIATRSPSPAITVSAPGTLAGTGSAIRPVTIDGTVRPGNADSPQGVFSLGTTALNGTLALNISGSACNRLDITGDLTLGATAAIFCPVTPTAPSYVIAKYTGTLSGNFVGASAPSGYQFVYDTTNKEIRLAAITGGFSTWIGGFGLTAGQQAIDADPDHDGVNNGIEYILGGNPATGMDAAKPPVGVLGGGNLTVAFDRMVASETPDVALSLQYGSNLANWTNVSLQTANPPQVTITRSGDGLTDHIIVVIPANPATQPKLFSRLSVAPTGAP